MMPIPQKTQIMAIPINQYITIAQLLLIGENGDPQALVRFSDAYCVSGMKICTTTTETMCLSRQPKQCFLQIDGVPLKQSEKFEVPRRLICK